MPDKFEVAKSYTTRPKRAEEKEGEKYHFIDHETFQKVDLSSLLMKRYLRNMLNTIKICMGQYLQKLIE